MFEVEALKSELMVVGITCKQEDRYNAFMQRYQPRLAENYRAFEQHFSRTRGRAGKSATDAYVTNLAQTRGFEAQKLGSDFCQRNPGLFDEVMALPSAAELPAYAAGQGPDPREPGGLRRRLPRPRAAGAVADERRRPHGLPRPGSTGRRHRPPRTPGLRAQTGGGGARSADLRRRRAGPVRSFARCRKAVTLAADRVVDATMTMDNDGGWCGIATNRAGPGLVTAKPAHGRLHVRKVGANTRVDYIPDRGFVGTDSFAVKLLPDQAELKVAATVQGAAAPQATATATPAPPPQAPARRAAAPPARKGTGPARSRCGGTHAAARAYNSATPTGAVPRAAAAVSTRRSVRHQAGAVLAFRAPGGFGRRASGTECARRPLRH